MKIDINLTSEFDLYDSFLTFGSEIEKLSKAKKYGDKYVSFSYSKEQLTFAYKVQAKGREPDFTTFAQQRQKVKKGSMTSIKGLPETLEKEIKKSVKDGGYSQYKDAQLLVENHLYGKDPNKSKIVCKKCSEAVHCKVCTQLEDKAKELRCKNPDSLWVEVTNFLGKISRTSLTGFVRAQTSTSPFYQPNCETQDFVTSQKAGWFSFWCNFFLFILIKEKFIQIQKEKNGFKFKSLKAIPFKPSEKNLGETYHPNFIPDSESPEAQNAFRQFLETKGVSDFSKGVFRSVTFRVIDTDEHFYTQDEKPHRHLAKNISDKDDGTYLLKSHSILITKDKYNEILESNDKDLLKRIWDRLYIYTDDEMRDNFSKKTGAKSWPLAMSLIPVNIRKTINQKVLGLAKTLLRDGSVSSSRDSKKLLGALWKNFVTTHPREGEKSYKGFSFMGFASPKDQDFSLEKITTLEALTGSKGIFTEEDLEKAWDQIIKLADSEQEKIILNKDPLKISKDRRAIQIEKLEKEFYSLFYREREKKRVFSFPRMCSVPNLAAIEKLYMQMSLVLFGKVFNLKKEELIFEEIEGFNFLYDRYPTITYIFRWLVDIYCGKFNKPVEHFYETDMLLRKFYLWNWKKETVPEEKDLLDILRGKVLPKYIKKLNNNNFVKVLFVTLVREIDRKFTKDKSFRESFQKFYEGICKYPFLELFNLPINFSYYSEKVLLSLDKYAKERLTSSVSSSERSDIAKELFLQCFNNDKKIAKDYLTVIIELISKMKRKYLNKRVFLNILGAHTLVKEVYKRFTPSEIVNPDKDSKFLIYFTNNRLDLIKMFDRILKFDFKVKEDLDSLLTSKQKEINKKRKKV